MSTDDDGIYKVDTVPPPQGEDDAYSAPTRVGVMASAIVGELLAQGDRQLEPLREAKAKDSAPAPAPTPRRSIPPPPAALADGEESEEEEEADAAPIKSPLFIEAAASEEDQPAEEDAPATAAAAAAADAPGSKLPMYALAAALIAVALYLLAR